MNPVINVVSSNCRTEHKQHQPSCPFLKIKDPYEITVGDILELEKAATENLIVRLYFSIVLYPLLLVNIQKAGSSHGIEVNISTSTQPATIQSSSTWGYMYVHVVYRPYV